MNRREALKLLTALPAVKSIEVADVAPNDVIVIESEDHVSQGMAARIETYLKDVWPNNKCVVLSHGLKLRIAREK